MAFDFPNSPALNATWPNPPVVGQPVYTWDGEKWLVVNAPSAGAVPAMALPIMDSIATVGVSVKYAREDHVHPTDTSRAAVTYVDTGDAARVAKAGDTMTYDLHVNRSGGNTGYVFYGTGSVYSGFDGSNLVLNGANVTIQNTLYVAGSSYLGQLNFASGGQPSFIAAIGATYWGFWHAGSSMCIGSFNTGGTATGAYLQLTTTGFGAAFDNCYKPSGGAWVAASDERIKTVVGDYVTGLDAIMALHPVRYKFKGNDTNVPPENTSFGTPPDTTKDAATVPYPNSLHYTLAVTGAERIGLVAQPTELVMPEMVRNSEGYIDGVHVDDLRMLDTSPLVFALVNAVKELAARVAALEGTK